MKYVFVDRLGAQAIWGLMNPVAAALVARGDEVTFCRFTDESQRAPLPVPEGVQVVDIRVPVKRFVWDLYRQHRAFTEPFRRLLRSQRPDLLHTHFCVPGSSARMVAYQENVPRVVATQHELYDSMVSHYRCAVRLTLRQADAVVYVSRAVARSFGSQAVPLAADPGQPPRRHAVIRNGVDIPRAEQVRQAAGPREPRKLVCVGRFIHCKGQHVLIRAMRAVADRFPDARLVLLGSGPREAALRRLADGLDLNGTVCFPGWLAHEDVLREAASAAAVIVPSMGEGFGLAVAEAMACRTPLVASRIEVFQEILGDEGHAGLLYERRDPAALAEAIGQVLTQPEEAARRAARAYSRVRSCFSIDRMVADYLRLYDSLAAPTNGWSRARIRHSGHRRPRLAGALASGES